MLLTFSVVDASLFRQPRQPCTRPQEVTEQDAIIAVGLVDGSSLTDSESVLACSTRMMIDFPSDPDVAYLEVRKCAPVCMRLNLRPALLRPNPWTMS